MDNDAYYRVLGAAIRGARERAGLSQGELGKKIGLSRTSVTNIEAGRQRLLVDQLEAIAGATLTPASELLPKPVVASKLSPLGRPSIESHLTPAVARFLTSLTAVGSQK